MRIMGNKKLSREELMDKISNSDSPLLTLFNNFFEELEQLEDDADDMIVADILFKAREFQEFFLDIVVMVQEVLEDNDIDLASIFLYSLVWYGDSENLSVKSQAKTLY